MPEAVIVAATRTPIGRAAKGSLVEARPDDMSAFIVKELLNKVPALDPNEVGGHVLAGYLTSRKPTDQEFDVLRTCVAARFAQSLVMGAYSYSLDPGNEYLLITAKKGWDLVKAFWALPKEDLYKKWNEIVESYQN